MNKSYKERLRHLVNIQTQGGTYEQAAEMWRAADEIAETFEHDGIRTEVELSDGDIRDAIADYHAVRRAGL